ncbi:signal-regulatory protein beta-2-like [Siniperca chuatsi]|uniref:signal-regulatory protein beta-2-like n=1 Tax=Siniperca chuatsi TaxID=119488 RepID=UPI001CE11F64|nr:signal-regulatory protein beta-2-like [Siniperca chuatsi]
MMMYFVNVFLLWSLCVAQFSDISQPVSFQTANLGDSATIECHIQSELKKRVWYKFTTWKRLQLVAAFDSYYNRSIIPDEFLHRYSLKFDKFSSHLTISATTWEEVGTYFCGVMYLNNITFGSGTFLMVKGAKMISDSVVQQPESQSVQPGDSVTLSCSVHTGHCAAEHTDVMWLKNSDHSAPEMIYSSGSKNIICQRTESGEPTCVCNLLMRNLSSDDAGTYCCVVTSCGQILFGNGTRINIHNTEPAELSPTVIALMLSNIILGIVTLILIWTLCKSRRKDSTEATDGSFEGNQTSDAVIYAAVCSAPRRLPPPRQATVKCSGDSVVYSDIRYCQQNQDVSSWDCRQTREEED